MPPRKIPDDCATISRFDQERERMHQMMLSSVSHDLRTPLASIIGSLEIYERMRDKLSIEKQEALISTALQESYRLDNFITNILDMAKLESGLVNAQMERCDIGGLLRDCLLRFGTLLQQSDVKVLDLSGHLEMVTDRTLLSRVVSLLLDNAVKYGGTPSTIRIEFGKDAKNIGFIRVYDNGLGIPPGDIEAIFCKYTRAQKQDQKNAGTGLGLAICREIMRLLNGSITAANVETGGAVFTLTFRE